VGGWWWAVDGTQNQRPRGKVGKGETEMPTQEQLDRMKQLDPGPDESKRLLLEIAEGSDHPKDVAIAKILRKELGEKLGG